MIHSVLFAGKPLDVYLTRRAERALARRASPLMVGMELRMGCMPRKSVVFHVPRRSGQLWVNDALGVHFRPLMLQSCKLGEARAEPPVIDFPDSGSGTPRPRWLRIDYRYGQWHGDFGLSDGPASTA